MKQCTSCYDYNLELSPEGDIKVRKSCGSTVEPADTVMPNIKKIINTRTVTITEAEGSRWIYVNPPGRWYQL